ncbi:hypothetical protein BpHYR1_000158 [Brachionus plicatilis]|uniref:Uncharacterized protein n=1 Tax=Brachionus plicatilis TaxID=10195 RepID=A0A3M7P5T2_BRAPC|nr:hypothetical protein BpHYR1_000158 [Brachionus plicatilis]
MKNKDFGIEFIKIIVIVLKIEYVKLESNFELFYFIIPILKIQFKIRIDYESKFFVLIFKCCSKNITYKSEYLFDLHFWSILRILKIDKK